MGTCCSYFVSKLTYNFFVGGSQKVCEENQHKEKFLNCSDVFIQNIKLFRILFYSNKDKASENNFIPRNRNVDARVETEEFINIFSKYRTVKIEKAKSSQLGNLPFQFAPSSEENDSYWKRKAGSTVFITYQLLLIWSYWTIFP